MIKNLMILLVIATLFVAIVPRLNAQDEDNPFLEWLLGQQVPNQDRLTVVDGAEGLVLSYAFPVQPLEDGVEAIRYRAWTYDQGLAIIALSLGAECEHALDIASAVSNLVTGDYRLPFSIDVDDGNRNARAFTGTLAWVARSFLVYQRACGDSQFQSQVIEIANAMVNSLSPLTGSLPGEIGANYYSAEHNIAAWYLFDSLSDLTGNPSYQETADTIAQSLLTLHFNSEYGCFQQGIEDITQVLDVAAIGVSFLVAQGQQSQAESCIDYIEENFSVTTTCEIDSVPQTISAYGPTPEAEFVWSEGSLQVAFAYDALGQFDQRNIIVSEIDKMLSSQGGVYYACPGAPDFESYPNVASTSLRYLLQQQ